MIKALFYALVLCCFLGGASPARAQWNVVASDDGGVAGAQPHLTRGENYEFTPSQVKGDYHVRTVTFGEAVDFGYDGLDRHAKYQLRATFSSDDARSFKIVADSVPMGDIINLKAGEVVTETIDIPARAYAYGSLVLEFLRLSGPNVTVAAVEILSDNRQPLTPLKNVPSVDIAVHPPSAQELAAALPAYRLPATTLTGVRQPIVRLDGTWKFSANPQGTWWKAATPSKDWKPIQVPGHWVQQGFTVPQDTFAGYFRSFDLPTDWRGQRVILRFDAVFSQAKIWVNGAEVGAHLGGMTRFEFDITPHLKVGRNTLAIAVKSWSEADMLGSLSQYTAFPMGGILRKVQLLAVPDAHLSDWRAETRFDSTFQKATLQWRVTITNSGQTAVNRQLVLKIPGTTVSASIAVPKLAAGESRILKGSVPAGQVVSWNPERPKLYALMVSLSGAVKTSSIPDRSSTFIHSEKIGFREVKVEGNRVLVNGVPIKLHGVNRHEVDPLGGRVESTQTERRDAELFRAANCNFIRTSHYPPTEEFIAACDELGLFVELEAPLGWVGHGANSNWQTLDYRDKKWFPYMLQANMETIQTYRDHPSIILWSEANESAWSNNFARVMGYMQAADPSRPQSFHDQAYGGFNNHGSLAPVANIHYPGLNGPHDVADFRRPITFGEFHHVNVYNRRDLLTDPSARDGWGESLDQVYSSMYATPAVLGGSIWAGIDDVFYLPNGVVTGYGPWGIIDGWRREKPEYWSVKKAYSPIRIASKTFEAQTASLTVENRYLFTNLNQIKARWKSGQKAGALALPRVAPGHSGQIALTPDMRSGQDLEISFYDPRGFTADIFRLQRNPSTIVEGPAVRVGSGPTATVTEMKVHDTANTVSIAAGGIDYSIDKNSGALMVQHGGRTLVKGGPHLYMVPFTSMGVFPEFKANIEPLNAICTNWKCEAVNVARQGDSATVTIKGAYDEAAGAFVLTIEVDGKLDVAYDFSLRQPIDPRQFGVVLDLPRSFDTLRWKRDTYWTVYPEDHIGRPEGVAHAFYPDCPQPRPLNDPTRPTWAWSHDATPLGSNDFRSTHRHFREASLHSPSDFVQLRADGDRDVRAWIENDQTVRFLLAPFTLSMSEPFAASYWHSETKPLIAGALLKSDMRIEFGNSMTSRDH